MQNHIVKTHKSNRTYSTHHFFVLSKGNNAGKPLDKPCPNCFVVTTNTKEQRDRLFCLCLGLWQAKHFYQMLTGSVIPFLRIHDLKDALIKSLATIEDSWDEFNKTVDAINSMNILQDNLMRQFKTLKELKISLLRKVLNKAKS